MAQVESNEWQTDHLFHITGYCLLLFVLFDFLDIFVPPSFMNPIWEFQTIGAVVDRVALPLLGLVLIFYKELNCRAKWEPIFLKLLSWASLLFGLLFLALIPLGLSSSLRINNINNTQIANQSAQQMTQVEQFEKQFSQATPNELESLLARLNTEDSSPDIKNPQELKNRLLTEVENTEKTLKAQAEATRKDKNIELIKSSLKWNIGALIAGILFIRIWLATHWARGATKRKHGW